MCGVPATIVDTALMEGVSTGQVSVDCKRCDCTDMSVGGHIYELDGLRETVQTARATRGWTSPIFVSMLSSQTQSLKVPSCSSRI